MRRLLVAFGMYCFLVSGSVQPDSLVSTAKSIASYGTNGAYMLTSLNEMYQWNNSLTKWVFVGNISGNKLRQIDSLSDGTNVVGTDDANAARKWNELSGLSASFSIEQSGTQFDWVILDPVTDATRGKLLNLPGWRTWNAPSLGGGDPWYKYLPAGIDGTAKVTPQYIVDKTSAAVHRWEREDTSYQVTLNQAGVGGSPFKVHYFGPSESAALNKITSPPVGNPETVPVEQISYDEDNQNLWCIDSSNQPWRWDNTNQEWILSNVRGEGGLSGVISDEAYADITAYLRLHRDFYVRTTFIDGVFRPLLIIFRDTLMMQLVLGTQSVHTTLDPEIIILEDPSAALRDGGPIILQPRVRPKQYLIRDKGRVREDGYVESLLVRYGIIASAEDTNIFPGTQFIMRR